MGKRFWMQLAAAAAGIGSVAKSLASTVTNNSESIAAGAVATFETGTATPSANPPVPADGDLELIVNINTGNVQIEGNDADIVSLQVTSASGGIIAANWQDMYSNGYSIWTDLGRRPTLIAEYDPQLGTGGFTLINGFIDYGDIYNTVTNPQDYVFQYGSVVPADDDGQITTYTGTVYYVPEPTMLGLMGLTAAGLLRRRRKRPRNNGVAGGNPFLGR
jgi:hypothetical protein